MTLLTVTLSVLIFAFFFLVYVNILKAGERFDKDLRLVLFLETKPAPEIVIDLKKRIREFTEVEKIEYVTREQAFKRLEKQLGDERNVLNDLSRDFLPPSIEVYPKKDLKNLSHIKELADYLATLPGAGKVQYGKDWIEHFYHFTELLRIIVLLSGCLLILTTVLMVSYTIRLTVVARQAELEILRLLGATNSFIRGPLVIEGVLQGALGSGLGLIFLYFLFLWVKIRFAGSGFLNLFEFSFFSSTITATILFAGIILCTCGSLVSIRKFLKV
ncbi:MAG: permease-like cell division protein FtsX [Thermodesulfobacteriota bacterium]|nr:permease-like cell division protein FtsX [Thermodesulfobacteriota bacterium]